MNCTHHLSVIWIESYFTVGLFSSYLNCKIFLLKFAPSFCCSKSKQCPFELIFVPPLIIFLFNFVPPLIIYTLSFVPWNWSLLLNSKIFSSILLLCSLFILLNFFFFQRFSSSSRRWFSKAPRQFLCIKKTARMKFLEYTPVARYYTIITCFSPAFLSSIYPYIYNVPFSFFWGETLSKPRVFL